MPAEVKKLSGFVGFANLPNQVHRKSIKEGFQFTLLVVGEAGLGKSTFVNSLFSTQIFPKKSPKAAGAEAPSSVQIQGYSYDIEEGGVKLKLNVLNAAGFGDFLNNSDSWQPIVKCIEERYDAYLDQERRVNRKAIIDNRVHCCLYFISPTGLSLKPLDIDFFKRVHDKVNIIPVIAKADTLSEEEKIAFKKRILADLEFHKINTYEIQIDSTDDAETQARSREFQATVPFAVIGSDKEFEVNGKKVRARKYPWGIIEVENEQHSDFIKLRNMLIKTHMEDLRSKTNEVLYENYRTNKLMNEAGGQVKKGENVSPLASFEEEKRLHEAKMRKMENEMKQVFDQKVKEKVAKLKEAEEKLHQDHKDQKAQLEQKIKDLEEKRRQFEEAQKNQDKDKKPKKKSGLF